MRVDAHGISVDAPAGWEVRITRRAAEGHEPGSHRRPVLHAATVPLPVVRGDFGGGVTGLLTSEDVFVSLFEQDPGASRTALFADSGFPVPTTGGLSPPTACSAASRPVGGPVVLPRRGPGVQPVRRARLARPPGGAVREGGAARAQRPSVRRNVRRPLVTVAERTLDKGHGVLHPVPRRPHRPPGFPRPHGRRRVGPHRRPVGFPHAPAERLRRRLRDRRHLLLGVHRVLRHHRQRRHRCPPGSLVGGWWKSDGSGFCCGGARYYIDCHSYCSCGCGGRSKFCGEGCRNCSCGCGPAGQCDQRKVCCNEFRYGQCNQDTSCTGPCGAASSPARRRGGSRPGTARRPRPPTSGTNQHTAPTLKDCTPIGGVHRDRRPGQRPGRAAHPRARDPRAGGTYQLFDFGSIYHSPGTGAHEVHGEVLATFAALGWEPARWANPTTDELRTPDGRGRFNHFEKGSVYWTPQTGASAVIGAIRETWKALGWKPAAGVPAHRRTHDPDGRGRFNHFERGSVYWTPQTGAHAVVGAIREEWKATGWETGPGYPLTDELRTPDGAAGSTTSNAAPSTGPRRRGARLVAAPSGTRGRRRGGNADRSATRDEPDAHPGRPRRVRPLPERVRLRVGREGAHAVCGVRARPLARQRLGRGPSRACDHGRDPGGRRVGAGLRTRRGVRLGRHGAHRVPTPRPGRPARRGRPERWGFPVEEPGREQGGQVRQRFAGARPCHRGDGGGRLRLSRPAPPASVQTDETRHQRVQPGGGPWETSAAVWWRCAWRSTSSAPRRPRCWRCSRRSPGCGGDLGDVAHHLARRRGLLLHRCGDRGLQAVDAGDDLADLGDDVRRRGDIGLRGADLRHDLSVARRRLLREFLTSPATTAKPLPISPAGRPRWSR